MKLAVFDFDGTLAETLNKPQTQQEADKIGWNGKNWWGSKCSLSKIRFHTNVTKAFQRDKEDPNTHVALLTGRQGPIAWKIRELLAENQLFGQRIIPKSNRKAIKHRQDKDVDNPTHDEYFTGDMITEDDYPRGGKRNKPINNTLTHKFFVIEKRLMNKTIDKVELWDDRKSHFDAFLQLAIKLLNDWDNLQEVIFHQVFPQPNVESPYIVNHCFYKINGEIISRVKNGNH